MAPEQIRGGQIEATADLYAVGVMAFHMLTGRRPFSGEQMSVLFAQVEEAPVSPSSLVPELSPELERIVLRLLAKNPAQRFQTAEAVRHELQAVPVGAPGKRRPPTKSGPEDFKTLPAVPSPPTGATTIRLGGVVRAKPAKPSRSRWVAGGGVVALCGIAAAGLFTVSRDPASAREHAPVTAVEPQKDIPPEVSAQALPDTPPVPETAAGRGGEEEKPQEVALQEAAPPEAAPQEAAPPEEEVQEEVREEVARGSTPTAHRSKRWVKSLTRKTPSSEPLAPAPSLMTAPMAAAVPMASNAQPSAGAAPVIVPPAAQAKPASSEAPPVQRPAAEAVKPVALASPREGLEACRPGRFDRRTQQAEILLARIDCLEARVRADAGGKKPSTMFLDEIGRLRQASRAVSTASERMAVTQSVDALKTRYDQQHGVLVLPATQTAQVSPAPVAEVLPASKPTVAKEASATAVQEPAPTVNPRSRIDRSVLLQRISQHEARLSETQALGREGEAQGALTKLDKLARKAETASERMAVAIQLDEWEQKFLPKR
jgi:eukaryotic-like serine/threonine-protein kinase